ncbi:MAG: exodeoxyribonuclease VII small subunit [Pirellulales bacterium]|nr:exodeoxyribonuclease VII small subunit [Pirellulales bacterium]
MPADSPPEAEQPASFEQSLARLESIVHDLEEGSLGLGEALARYEQGVGLLTQCYGLLERAERKIELLTGVDASGNPVTAAQDDREQSLEEKSQSRSRRRSAPAAGRGKGTGPTGPDADMDAC